MESAISGVGQVADEVRKARIEAAAAGSCDPKAASFSAQAESAKGSYGGAIRLQAASCSFLLKRKRVVAKW